MFTHCLACGNELYGDQSGRDGICDSTPPRKGSLLGRTPCYTLFMAWCDENSAVESLPTVLLRDSKDFDVQQALVLLDQWLETL